jgi:RNA polymerase sigma-70 factor (ECF subfamily)
MVNECISLLEFTRKDQVCEDEIYVEDSFDAVESQFSIADINY